MRIEKVEANGKSEVLEKIIVPVPSVVFILSHKDHKPKVKVFAGVV